MTANQRHRTVLAVTWMILAAGFVSSGPSRATGPELASMALEVPALVQKLERARVRTVAVPDFTDLRGRSSELGRFLAERLSGELADGTDTIRVIDRLNLATILREHKLSATGVIDQETLHQIGRISGVDALVTGRLVPLGDRVLIILLVIRTDSADVLLSKDVEIPRTRTISELERRILTVDCPPGAALPEVVTEGPPRQQQDKKDYQLRLYGCQRAGDAIQCALAVRNLADDRNLMLYGRSWVTFGEGSPVEASRIAVSGEWATGSLSRVGAAVPSGVTSTVALVFEGVPETVETLRRLELDFYGFEVEFDDVPVDR